jgi:hypothetical protein
MQPSNISNIFAKVEHFNFGQIINHLSLPFLVFQPPFHPENNTSWHSFQNLMCKFLYLPGLKNVVADFLSRPNQITAGSVAAVSAADPVDSEEMAAEQNSCPETQRLLGGTSLKLAFCQTGAHRLAGDVSTGNFRSIVPLKFRKNILIIFTMSLTPGGSPPVVLFHLDLCGAAFQRRHRLGPRVSGLPAGQGPPSHTPGSPPHPHPATAFFSPTC